MYSGEDRKEEAVLKYCRENMISRNSQKALDFYNILDDEGKIVEDEIGMELGSKFQYDGAEDTENCSKSKYDELKNELEDTKWHLRKTQYRNDELQGKILSLERKDKDLIEENLSLKNTVLQLQTRLKAQTDSHNQLIFALHGSTNSYQELQEQSTELQEQLAIAEAKLARLGIVNNKLHSEEITTAPNTNLGSLSSDRSTAAVNTLSGGKPYFVTK